MISINDLRAMMIKYPSSRLWGKRLSKWREGDKRTFADMLEGKIDKTKTRRKMKRLDDKSPASNAVKVIRVSDGKVYESISQCKELTGLHDVAIRSKLKAGTEFKTLN